MNVLAPGSAVLNVTVVVEWKLPSPGPPVPSVRSSAMSYPRTLSSRARSIASAWARLRTPLTFASSPSAGHGYRPHRRYPVRPSFARQPGYHVVVHFTVGCSRGYRSGAGRCGKDLRTVGELT